MKVDFTTPIKDIRGKSIDNGTGTALTLGSVLVDVIIANRTGHDDAVKQYAMAKRILAVTEGDLAEKDDGVIDLKLAEVKELQDLLKGVNLPSQVKVPAVEILEESANGKKKKKRAALENESASDPHDLDEGENEGDDD